MTAKDLNKAKLYLVTTKEASTHSFIIRIWHNDSIKNEIRYSDTVPGSSNIYTDNYESFDEKFDVLCETGTNVCGNKLTPSAKEKLPKVKIWGWSHNDGEYLWRGDSFEEGLLMELEHYLTYYPDNADLRLLISKVEESERSVPEDFLFNLLITNLTLDFEFAKQLKLFDIITPTCFSTETAIGKALITLMEYADFRFILFRRNWDTMNEIEVEFEVCHMDYDREVHSALIINGRLE